MRLYQGLASLFLSHFPAWRQKPNDHRISLATRLTQDVASKSSVVVDSKTLVVSPEPFYENRGTPIAIMHVLRALSESGKKVDLVTYHLGKDVELAGLNIYRCYPLFGIRHVPIGFSIRKLWLDIALILTLFKRLRKTHYDCIHAVEEMAFPAVILGYWYKIPIIYDMQSSLPEQMGKQSAFFRHALIQRPLRSCERWLIRHCHRVVCSAGLGQHVQKTHPKAWVMEWRFPSQCINTSAAEVQKLRSNICLAEPNRIVLYAGNFKSYQGIEQLEEAVPKVLSAIPNVTFLFIGLHNHSDRIWAEKISERYDEAQIKVLPRQSREKATQLLMLADILVSPRTDNSNLPLKIFDYLAAGKPIVATDIASHRQVLDDDCAAFFKPFAVDQLAQQIILLLQDHVYAKRLGEAAAYRADEICSWGAFKQQLDQLHNPHPVTSHLCLNSSSIKPNETSIDN